MKCKRKALVISLILIGAFYGIISLVPHYNFNSNAFDLGIFNQTIFQYAHFQLGPNTVREVQSLLADHLELLLFIFSPLYWLFGSYTLLIVQILMLLFGACGVYLLLKHKTKSEFLSVGGTIIFSLFFGLVTAMGFDYHNNVVGTMFIPWLFYMCELKRFKWYYLFLVLFLVSKENMALMAIFLGISILIFDKQNNRKHGLITIVISALYFILSLKLISYLNGGIYDHWPYGALGDSPGSALKTILLHPIQSFSLFFDHSVKIKMWILLSLSGGILAIFQPKYFIILVPVIAQKFFSDQEAFWGFSHHYAVEFAPIVAIGSILAIHNFTLKKYRRLFVGIVVVFNLGILSQIHFYNGDNVARIFSKGYYQGPKEKQSIMEAISLVEIAKSVSAQNTFIPHLKNKDIFLFPDIAQSEYVILNANSKNSWPLKNNQELVEEIDLFKQNKNYEEIFSKGGVYVFKRKASANFQDEVSGPVFPPATFLN